VPFPRSTEAVYSTALGLPAPAPATVAWKGREGARSGWIGLDLDQIVALKQVITAHLLLSFLALIRRYLLPLIGDCSRRYLDWDNTISFQQLEQRFHELVASRFFHFLPALFDEFSI
jgi:hypothetical protein